MMTGAGMKALVKTKITALAAESGGGNIQFVREDILQALCEGIVEYIQENAVVDSTGEVTSGEGSGGSLIATGVIE